MKYGNVAVLMSTYNGAKFLPEQIDSILSQRDIDVAIKIRDDGSSDETIGILQDYSTNKNISIEYGHNVGPARSFASLLYSTSGYKFYSYADQDDIWLPLKLKRAVDSMGKLDNSIPLLYLANATVVDQQRSGSTLLVNSSKSPCLDNALVQCFSIGATMVFNEAARLVLINRAVPLKMTMHDWWTYLVISALGKVVYDPAPTMLYRQHENNLFGDAGHWRYLFNNWRKIIAGHSMQLAKEQARDFLEIYNDTLNTSEKAKIANFSSPQDQSYKFVSAIQQPIFKKSRIGTLVARIQWLASSF